MAMYHIVMVDHPDQIPTLSVAEGMDTLSMLKTGYEAGRSASEMSVWQFNTDDNSVTVVYESAPPMMAAKTPARETQAQAREKDRQA